MIKVLILGGTGMLGHTLFAHLFKQGKWDVYATSRNNEGLTPWFEEAMAEKVLNKIDANYFDTVTRALAVVQPDIVINCIGLIKQSSISNDPLSAITVNAQFPHRLSILCSVAGARMIHISTDCVFDGMQGGYSERDETSACDMYGRTKFLGEVVCPHCITLRTSIIGHELKGYRGLVEWLLSQQESVKGFRKAIFSGFPTIELARIISDFIIPKSDLSGLYHVSSSPIDKFALLKMVSEKYQKKIVIEPYDHFQINRSLDSKRFCQKTGYQPPSWQELIDRMHDNFIVSSHYKNR